MYLLHFETDLISPITVAFPFFFFLQFFLSSHVLLFFCSSDTVYSVLSTFLLDMCCLTGDPHHFLFFSLFKMIPTGASHSHHLGKGFQPDNHLSSHTQHKASLWISLWPSPHQVSGYSQHWDVPDIVKISERLLVLQARAFSTRKERKNVTAALIHHRFLRHGARNTLLLVSSTRGLTAHIRGSQATLLSRSFGVCSLKTTTFSMEDNPRKRRKNQHLSIEPEILLHWSEISVPGHLVWSPQRSLTKCRLQLFYHSLFSYPLLSPGNTLCTGAYTE